jgi:hypothetical protein
VPLQGSLTERQEKWFASVREGLARETGRSLDEWTDLARACPETAHRKRLAWMKATYGLGQNRASLILNAAFPPQAGWSRPETLAGPLWAEPAARAVHEAIARLATALPDVIIGQRKGFTAYSRRLQFCAARPHKGAVLLGLAVPPREGLTPSGKDGWSERLLSKTVLRTPAEADDRLAALLREAWTRS